MPRSSVYISSLWLCLAALSLICPCESFLLTNHNLHFTNRKDYIRHDKLSRSSNSIMYHSHSTKMSMQLVEMCNSVAIPSISDLAAAGSIFLSTNTDLATSTLLGGMLAGAAAGAAVDCILYPIDTIKTRLQTGASWRSAPLRFYAGLLGSLAGHVPSSAFFFAVYETSKLYVFEPHFGPGAAAAQLLAGVAGNAAASVIRVPTEVVKTRVQSGAEPDAAAAVRGVLRADGPAGLFRGYAALLLRDLPFDAIEFVVYEQLKLGYVAAAAAVLAVTGVTGAVGGSGAAAAAAAGAGVDGPAGVAIGALAGGITAAVTAPLDTVRAQMMNRAGEKGLGVETAKETAGGVAGVVDAAAEIVGREGIGGLFAGVTARVAWLTLGGAVFFPALEAAKKLFMPAAGG